MIDVTNTTLRPGFFGFLVKLILVILGLVVGITIVYSFFTEVGSAVNPLGTLSFWTCIILAIFLLCRVFSRKSTCVDPSVVILPTSSFLHFLILCLTYVFLFGSLMLGFGFEVFMLIPLMCLILLVDNIVVSRRLGKWGVKYSASFLLMVVYVVSLVGFRLSFGFTSDASNPFYFFERWVQIPAGYYGYAIFQTIAFVLYYFALSGYVFKSLKTSPDKKIHWNVVFITFLATILMIGTMVIPLLG